MKKIVIPKKFNEVKKTIKESPYDDINKTTAEDWNVDRDFSKEQAKIVNDNFDEVSEDLKKADDKIRANAANSETNSEDIRANRSNIQLNTTTGAENKAKIETILKDIVVVSEKIGLTTTYYLTNTSNSFKVKFADNKSAQGLNFMRLETQELKLNLSNLEFKTYAQYMEECKNPKKVKAGIKEMTIQVITYGDGDKKGQSFIVFNMADGTIATWNFEIHPDYIKFGNNVIVTGKTTKDVLWKFGDKVSFSRNKIALITLEKPMTNYDKIWIKYHIMVKANEVLNTAVIEFIDTPLTENQYLKTSLVETNKTATSKMKIIAVNENTLQLELDLDVPVEDLRWSDSVDALELIKGIKY